MKRAIAILLGVLLAASAQAVLADGNKRSGGHGMKHGKGSFAGHRGGGTSAHVGNHGGRIGITFGHHLGRPHIGVRPAPVIIGRPHVHHHHRRPVVVSTIVVGTPFFYSPPVYAAPVVPVPVYQEPTVYVERGPETRWYCPDYRDYYPTVATCPSPWLQVLVDASAPPN